MSASFSARGQVAVLDLRGRPVADGLRVVEEVASDASGGYRDAPSVDHALILVDAHRLLEHSATFEAIHRSHRFEGVICLATGAGDHDEGAPSLRVPAILDNSSSAVLWAGDAKGVSWRLGAGRRVQPPSDVMDDHRPALDQLVKTLCEPAIFDAVVALSRQMPGHAASPGILTLSGDMQQGDLAAAEAEAIKDLVGDGGPEAREPGSEALDRALATLLGAARDPSGDDPIVPGSEVDKRRRTVDGMLLAAAAETRRMARFGGLVAADRPGLTIWNRVIVAGSALAGYRGLVVELLDQPHGVSAARLTEVQRRGVVCQPKASVDRATVVKELRRTVEEGLAQASVRQLAHGLRGLIERANPRGTLGALDRLSNARQGSIEDRLSAPPAFVLPLKAPSLLTAALVSACLAALDPRVGLYSGATFALVWLLTVWGIAGRQPMPDGELGLARAAHPALAWHALVAVVGVAAGVLIGRSAAPPRWLAMAGGLAAVVVLLTALSRWWSSAVRGWTSSFGLAAGNEGEIADATRPYRKVLADVAVREWQQMEMRRFLCDAALAVAMALEDVGDALTTYLETAGAHTGAGQEPYEHTPDERSEAFVSLRTIVRSDLVDAVRTAASGRWDRLGVGAYERFANGLADHVLELLDTYEQHLAKHNVFAPPPFSTERPERDGLLDSVTAPPSHTLAVLMSQIDDAFVQLCGVDELGLLNPASSAAALIKFAPSFSRRQLTALLHESGQASAAHLNDVQWVSGHLAGLLRLVPVRPGVAETLWATSSDTGTVEGAAW